MSKFVDELHNHEDSTSLLDSILFFLGGAILLLTLCTVFWSAF